MSELQYDLCHLERKKESKDPPRAMLERKSDGEMGMGTLVAILTAFAVVVVWADNQLEGPQSGVNIEAGGLDGTSSLHGIPLSRYDEKVATAHDTSGFGRLLYGLFASLFWGVVGCIVGFLAPANPWEAHKSSYPVGRIWTSIAMVIYFGPISLVAACICLLSGISFWMRVVIMLAINAAMFLYVRISRETCGHAFGIMVRGD